MISLKPPAFMAAENESYTKIRKQNNQTENLLLQRHDAIAEQREQIPGGLRVT
jgi:hypothetical protein